MTTCKSGFITLIGLPNAGKSSLLNHLVGEELAIVTPKAQTTWACLRGYVSRPDFEMVVTDTPGLQEGSKALNAALSKNAAKAIALASEGDELVCLVIDAAEIGRKIREKKPLGIEAIKNVLERDCGGLPLKLPVLPVLNKSDLVRKTEYRKEIEEVIAAFSKEVFAEPKAPIWISSRSGEGVPEWVERIKALLPEGQKGQLFEEDALSDQSVRTLAAEFIREQCFMQLGAEVPYSTAVQIETFDETSDKNLVRIEATLHVERESQKALVIGKGGSKIKDIGIKARLKIEKLVDKKVYLGLKVRVTPHWAREEKWVKRFGYAPQK